MRRTLFATFVALALGFAAWTLLGARPAGAAVLDSPAAAPVHLGRGMDRDAALTSKAPPRRVALPAGGVFSYSPARNANRRPLLAVIGASFSAGVGAGSPRFAWPNDLARMLHWRLVDAADPGAGFLNRGTGHLGPFSRLMRRLDLARRSPRVVIVQGGHDDMGFPLSLEKGRARQLITAIEHQAPGARIAVVLTFTARPRPTERALAISRAVAAGARAADPAVILFNPVKSSWDYPRLPGHLHPTKAGYEWLARRLAHLLKKNGCLRPPSMPRYVLSTATLR